MPDMPKLFTGISNKIPLAKQLRKFRHFKARLIRIATYILLFDVAFVFLYPFLYMVVTSFKTNADLNNITVNWIPRTIKYENYIVAFRAMNYADFFKTSVIYTVVGTLGHLLSCSFIGYGFARHEFPFKKSLFFLVLVAIIVPVQTIIVPLYMIFANLKWVDTYLPVLIPTFFGFGLRGGLFIFIFRQFYQGLPKALEEAARIDGCGFLKTYWKIVLPVVKSAFLVTVVLSMVWHWNDFYEPSIYVSKQSMLPLPMQLQALVNLVKAPPEELFKLMDVGMWENTINNAVLMAGTFLVVIPILVTFTFLQKKFTQGIERTGLVE